MDYAQSSNQNTVGRFLEGAFLKPGESLIINTNKTKVLECLQTIGQLKLKVNEEDKHIFSADGRRFKASEFSLHHTFNLDI